MSRIYDEWEKIEKIPCDERGEVIYKLLEEEAKIDGISVKDHAEKIIAYCSGIIICYEKIYKHLDSYDLHHTKPEGYDFYHRHLKLGQEVEITIRHPPLKEEKHEQTRPQARRNICRP